ncbi:hypothetical protein JCM9533A_67810 [Catenuloplanes niger JCM 9533]
MAGALVTTFLFRLFTDDLPAGGQATVAVGLWVLVLSALVIGAVVVSLRGVRSSEESLRRRTAGELRAGEMFVAGAAGRARTRWLPQSMSLRGCYVVLTSERVLTFAHDRLTGRPAGVTARIELPDLEGGDVESVVRGRSVRLRLRKDAKVVFDLVFSGGEKRAGATIASGIAGAVAS